MILQIAHQDDWGLWCLAQEIVREHGPDAPGFAAKRADQLLGKGDIEGTHQWCIVVRRASILLEQSRAAVH